ncbi:MAG: YebC/PmpR family DNA-binding transcriptional regulator [Candidatus Omnitrophota bacterium]
MSGHSKWASIKHKKAATDAKRGAAFTKIIREITAAARERGRNLDSNPRLRTVIERAKQINMPSTNIENAIKKGTGELPGVSYENFVFDAYAPGGVALLIEGLTDNKNRTTAEIRNILSKKNGSLAGAGSTAWMFTKKGFISVPKDKVGEEELMEIALEAGADDIKSEEGYYEITCDVALLETVQGALQGKNIPIETAEITMIPNSTVKVVGSDAAHVLTLLEALDDHEDVQAVHANFDIPDEDMEKNAKEA